MATLFLWMSIGAAAIWAAMMVLTAYSLYGPRPQNPSRAGAWLIVAGGVVLPVAVLIPLLVTGLAPLSRRIDAATSPITLDVIGEQWWWRVQYHSERYGSVDTANEIRLPRGERIDVRLASHDVIHSFWIPSLAGKVDMIPGRTTYLALEPFKSGRYRGVCAEYCGTSHALMAFDVEVLEPAAFDEWLGQQASEARPPARAEETRGLERFLANGCGACHAVRGTAARGASGPDLTHVGGRISLAAATIANRHDEMARWITHAGAIKPETQMPSFAMLPSADVADMAAYLSALR